MNEFFIVLVLVYYFYYENDVGNFIPYKMNFGWTLIWQIAGKQC